MKIPILRSMALAVVLLASSACVFSKANPELVPEPAKAALPAASNLASFEFLGCSGDWSGKDFQPRVWRAGRKGKTTFLIQHPAACGYTTATGPAARIAGGSIEFSYSMSNEHGMLAACLCEYWASFELESVPDKIEAVSINGEDARLMSDLADP